MINLIREWGIPAPLQGKNVDFVFSPDEILDTINNLKNQHVKNYYNDLHWRDGSVKFCLYDFDPRKIVFTMDFFKVVNFFNNGNEPNSDRIKLQILYVNDPELRNKGIATYYLKRLQEYAIADGISFINIHPNPNDKLFMNKENALSKKQLIDFYNNMSNEQVTIKLI